MTAIVNEKTVRFGKSCRDARRTEQKARDVGAPFSVFIVKGATHFSELQPVSALVAKKVLADTGPACNIKFKPEEVRAAFDFAKE